MVLPLSSLYLLLEEKDETIFSMVASKPTNEDAPFFLALAFLLPIGRSAEATEEGSGPSSALSHFFTP
jgi:hypothetical protein